MEENNRKYQIKILIEKEIQYRRYDNIMLQNYEGLILQVRKKVKMKLLEESHNGCF